MGLGTLRDDQGILKVDFTKSSFRAGPGVGPSNRGTRVAESKSTIGIDRGMICEEMLLWLESRAGDGPGIPRDPQGASRDP
mgnify:CR=1 FL=1